MYVCNKLLPSLFVVCAGCASMCDGSLDCDYHAFGGMRDRHDRVNGRVGSLFDPAASLEAALIVDDSVPRIDGTQADSTGTDTNTGPDTGNVEDSGLKDKLLNKLREMQDLPNVPSAGDALDDSTGLDEI